MFINFLSAYLFFVLAVSILVTALIFFKIKLPPLRALIPVVIAVILFPAAAGYLYFAYFTPFSEVIVPNVQGMPLSQALLRLEIADLQGNLAGTEFDRRFASGEVVSQRPEGGRRVKAGRIVNLIASSGRRKVMVPNLLGRSLVQVEAVLAAKGLSLGIIEKNFLSELEPGIVLMQNPIPEEEVEAQSFVDITISASGEGEGENKQDQEKDKEEKKEGGFWLW